eukprot:11240356-Ditylum_brightwellii.AAC.1
MAWRCHDLDAPNGCSGEMTTAHRGCSLVPPAALLYLEQRLHLSGCQTAGMPSPPLKEDNTVLGGAQLLEGKTLVPISYAAPPSCGKFY